MSPTKLWAMRAVWRGVLLGISIGRVGGDLGGNVVSNALRDPVAVGEQPGELIVERFQMVSLGRRMNRHWMKNRSVG